MTIKEQTAVKAALKELALNAIDRVFEGAEVNIDIHGGADCVTLAVTQGRKTESTTIYWSVCELPFERINGLLEKVRGK